MLASKRLDFPCDVASGREAARTIKAFLEQQGYDESTVFACELSLTEGCNNAVQHATPEQRTRPLAVEVDCTPTHIELRLADHTAGFEMPASVPPPDPATASGRGLFIMRSMMDDVDYLRRPNGNVLVLKKRVTRPSPLNPAPTSAGG